MEISSLQNYFMRNLFVSLLFTISLTAYSTTYYIDPSGQDASTNNGSKTSPWKSLSYACSKVKTSGDVIHVNPGSYFETVQSSLTAGVSIEGEGISSNITSNISKLYTFTILLSSTSSGTNGNQHICNIKMDGNGLTAYGAIRVAYRKNVEIYNCTFINFNYFGVSFINGEPPSTYATGNKFHDNTVTNCSGFFSGNMGCLEIQGQDGMLIYNNTMTQNRSNGLNGDIIYGVEGYLKNVKIYNNTLNKTYVPGTTPWDFAIEFWNCLGGVEIYDNTITGSIDLVNSVSNSSAYSVWIHNNIIGQSTSGSSESTRGVLLEASEEDVIIEANDIRNVAAGIYFSQVQNARIVKNIYIKCNMLSNIGVSDLGSSNKGWGIFWTTETYKNHTVDNLNICNNVFIGNSGARSNMWGINLPNIGTAKNITIRNNIIKDFDFAPIYAYTQTGAQTIDVLSIENNIFYQCGNNNSPKYNGITPTNNTTRNNITSNPLFLSASDFHLQAGSPAIGKGLKITDITNDFDGNTFNDPPSIGIYEYFVAAVPVYQSALIANTSPSILEMTYNYSLANIPPAPSAFSVQVNSVARGVNTVSISGTKVRLTLSSSVVAGDIVTVSYTKPASNPLQTPSGGEADNISSKPVVNNVASVVPVYSSSVVENLTPTLLVLTYSLSLANVTPASSAFTVLVNSVARSVNSVSISGSKVSLTLASAIKFGDVVTVSYTKPAINRLQATSGGEAANISAKPVTNNLADPAKPNEPPIIEITSEEENFSGFVGEIDASGTHDVNNDPLIYEWTVPDSVQVSSTSEAIIRFLSPKVNVSKTYTFQLRVSDGLASVTKSVSINVLPYKPKLVRVMISDVQASDFEATNFPQNVIDGDFSSKWAISGDNQWLLLKLKGHYMISHIELAFLKGQNYSSFFDIYASQDNVIWEPVLLNAASCDFSGDAQVFDFPASFAGTEYGYLKLIGHGNSEDNTNIISEFTVFSLIPNASGGERDVVIYPNPADDNFYISISEQIFTADTVRIYELSGKIVFEKSYEAGLIHVQLPSYIKSGIYIVELSSGPLTMFAQQLIIQRR
jgi:uncharacterized repeat protein (TIGR02059 family)